MVTASRSDDFDLHDEDRRRLEEIRSGRVVLPNHRPHPTQVEFVGTDFGRRIPILSIDDGMVRRGVEVHDEDVFPLAGFNGLCIGNSENNWSQFAN